MGLPLDVAADFAGAADGLEPVTVSRPGSPAPARACRALRRGVTAQEAQASEGRYTAADAAWHLPAAELDGPPRPGDVIADGGGRRWTVLAVAASYATGRFRCLARDLAIAHGLDAFIDVDEAVYAKGEGGAETAAWRPWRTGVRARIQPVLAAPGQAGARRTTRTACTIYVAGDLPLEHRHRIRGPDGAVYRVAAVRKPGRIDALTEIDAIRET